jgi:hypothetical protein
LVQAVPEPELLAAELPPLEEADVPLPDEAAPLDDADVPLDDDVPLLEADVLLPEELALLDDEVLLLEAASLPSPLDAPLLEAASLPPSPDVPLLEPPSPSEDGPLDSLPTHAATQTKTAPESATENSFKGVGLQPLTEIPRVGGRCQRGDAAPL